jgi:hypothetical protein
VLSLVNRSGNRLAHQGAADLLDLAILLCRDASFRTIYLRVDTDFTQTKQLDAWDAEGVTFHFGGPMPRSFAAALAICVVTISSSGVTAWAEDRGRTPDDVPKVLAPAFRPPAEFRDEFGSYKSPLTLDDGRPVRDAAGWRKRRKEILASWHGIMGAWPPLIERPKVEDLGAERRDGFEQRRVRVEVTKGIAWDGRALKLE